VGILKTQMRFQNAHKKATARLSNYAFCLFRAARTAIREVQARINTKRISDIHDKINL
jgi:hypothetical protein